MKRRVVVTGLGIVSPLSCNVDECWRKTIAGESGIGNSNVTGIERMRARIAGHVHDFDPSPTSIAERSTVWIVSLTLR